MIRSRRSFLVSSGVAVAALSGCQELRNQDTDEIELILFNYTTEDQPLEVALLREDENTEVLDKDYIVPGRGDDTAGRDKKSNIAPDRRYLVRVTLGNRPFERNHAHYYPETSERPSIRIRIRRDEETSQLYVDFGSL